MELSKKCLQDWFFSQLKLTFCHSQQRRFLNLCLSPHFPTNRELCNCPIFCSATGNGNLRPRICQKVPWFYESSWWTHWILFETTFLIFAIKASIKICCLQINFQGNLSGKCHCVAQFMDRSSQKMEVIWVFLENKPAYIKTHWQVFVHLGISCRFFAICKNVRGCPLLCLISGTAYLIGGNCKTLHNFMRSWYPISIFGKQNQMNF